MMCAATCSHISHAHASLPTLGAVGVGGLLGGLAAGQAAHAAVVAAANEKRKLLWGSKAKADKSPM